jgi:hypothetical protein
MKRILTLTLSLVLLAFGVAKADAFIDVGGFEQMLQDSNHGTFIDVGGFEQMLKDSNADGEFNGCTMEGHIDYSASAETSNEVILSA